MGSTNAGCREIWLGVRPPKKCVFRNHLNVMVFFSHLPIDALFSKVSKQESAFSGG